VTQNFTGSHSSNNNSRRCRSSRSCSRKIRSDSWGSSK